MTSASLKMLCNFFGKTDKLPTNLIQQFILQNGDNKLISKIKSIQIYDLTKTS